eukprot:SAG25_NODE_469_length_7669_cov_4.786262_3_plen_191_part_00
MSNSAALIALGRAGVVVPLGAAEPMPSSSSSSSSSSGSSSSSSASAGRGPPSQGGHGGRHSRQRGRHESGSSTRRRSRSPPRRSRSPPPHHRRRYGSPSYRGHDERHSRGGQRSRSRSRSRSSGRRRRRPEPPRPRRPTQHKLFVGGLSWTTDDAQLQDAFAVYGEVSEAKVWSRWYRCCLLPARCVVVP